MRTIRVTGKGQIKVHPDMTRIVITLEGIDTMYGEAIRRSSEDTEEMKELLVPFGFRPSDLKTLSFGVDTEYESYRDKNNDYVAVTIARPYSPRTTGPKSQNHHLNGHIMQICEATGNDYETIKYCIKMIAVEQMGYSFQTIAGHVVPKRESDCNTEECGKLIEASHILAAQLGIILREVNE